MTVAVPSFDCGGHLKLASRCFTTTTTIPPDGSQATVVDVHCIAPPTQQGCEIRTVQYQNNTKEPQLEVLNNRPRSPTQSNTCKFQHSARFLQRDGMEKKVLRFSKGAIICGRCPEWARMLDVSSTLLVLALLLRDAMGL